MKFPFGPGILSEAMLVAGTVPWPLCILQENRGPGGGVGMVTFTHLHTCEMLRNCWAGVGMMTFMHLHTFEMLRNCWAGVGMMTFMHLTHVRCSATDGPV